MLIFSGNIIISFFVVSIALVHASGESNIIVVRIQQPYEQILSLNLNNSVEYIIEFVPNSEQALWPTRVFLHSEGADLIRPVLVTARQTTGAITWQIPYTSTSGRLLNELEQTLCPASQHCSDTSQCVGENETTRGVSLHVGSTCLTPVVVTVTVTAVREWLLGFQAERAVLVSEAAPRTLYYNFDADQNDVRLQISSTDDICAVVSIQNYTCPILQDEVDIDRTQRMTVQRSGGVQLSRRMYPLGFYVVAVVLSSDVTCTGEVSTHSEDWLWEEAFLGGDDRESRVITRMKTLHLRLEPALTRGQYAVASVVTLVVFLSFYVFFLGFVFAQKYEPFRRLVGPVEIPQDEGQTEEASPTVPDGPSSRRRRGSTATFDSSDNSDSDESERETDLTPGSPVTTRDAARTTTADNAPPPTTTADGAPPPTTTADNAPLPTTTADNAPPPTTTADGAPLPTTTADNAPLPTTTADGAPPRTTIADGAPPPTTTADTPHVNGIQEAAAARTPYGLPARLRLAALSRHNAKVLRVRSDRYLWTLLTVAVFYALPVVQFVTAFQLVLNFSGSLDICYYNFLCAHPAGQISDFNHVYSNLGYLLLGVLFIIQVKRRRSRRKKNPRKEEYGIPMHYGLLTALGAGLMIVGVLSASYHICPNRLNFQFDTAFMYVLSVIMMVKIYQSRHPDVNARAHATFGVLALIIALGVWGVLGGGAYFWGLFTVIHLMTFLMLSLRIYYVGQFRLEKETLQRAARGLAAIPKHGVQPLYKTRLVMLLIANCVNWALALYGLWTQSSDFASHLLTVLLGNTLLYMAFYLTMKMLHGERPRWYSWCFLIGATAAWIPGLYFFASGSSSWSSTPAQSRHRNHECKILQFYDSHDLWHMLSAIALYLTFNTLLTWDDGMAAVKRTEIAVF